MTLPPDDLDALEKMFLCKGTGFKLHFNQSGNCTTLANYSKELEGRWVALVPAEDNEHTKFLRMARRCVEMEAALRQAIDLISIPASRHHDGRDHITGAPRYSAGLLKHHAECAALLPILKAALPPPPSEKGRG